MTKIIFIRHGEPDYTFVKNKNYSGHGINMAQLTEAGIQQAEAVSRDNRLDSAEIIISSPYTRALQTAAVISKNRNLDIKIELDLHEWLPDLMFQNSTLEEVKKAVALCKQHKGACPKESEIVFEGLEDVFTRVKNCLLKHTEYKKIIVVAHDIVMRQFAYEAKIPFCGIKEIDFDEQLKWCGFKELSI